MHLKQRTTCRVCNSKLTEVFSLGEQYLQGSFYKEGISNPPLRKIPLTIALCDTSLNHNACGLLQLKHSVPPEILYKKYWYRSGTNSTMRDHLSKIAEDIKKYNPSSILDIGCNDGTLLKCFGSEVERIGVDPSDAVSSITDMKIINKCFPCDETKDLKVDIITSIAMFYDLENPVEFARSVKQCLTPNGLWIFEVAYLPSMLKNTAFDNICHEHIEYYSLAVLDSILDKVDMHVIKAEINDVNCGSILVWASSKDSCDIPKRESLEAIREAEFDMRLDDINTYLEFSRNIDKTITQLEGFVKFETLAGKSIHIYGASTKGNTVIQACNLNKYIKYASERNPEKWGAKTLGTNISIISEEESRAMKPDYYLVLPWHFKKEFIDREKSTIASGTKFIFPFPSFEVIG